MLLENVDTLKNVVDSLMKCVGAEKFIWCRETRGYLVYSNELLKALCLLCIQRKQQVVNVGYVMFFS